MIQTKPTNQSKFLVITRTNQKKVNIQLIKAINKKEDLEFVLCLKKASKIYDYSNDQIDFTRKTNKKLAVNRLENMLDDNEYLIKYFIPSFENVMEMIIKNIFMKVNPVAIFDNLSDLSIADTAVTTNTIILNSDYSWSYVQGIFNIFYKLIISSYFSVKLYDYVDKAFITKVDKVF